MKLNFVLILFFLFGLYSCNKSTERTCPAISTHSVPTFYRQFNFKSSSKWIYLNSTSNAIDTITGWLCGGFQIYQQYNGSSHGACATDKFESYMCNLRHNMFTTSSPYISYSYGYTSPKNIAVFQQYVGDSIKFSGSTTQYIKLENYFATLVINGTTFNNVYQMYYYPDLQGFTRLWWCPTIGIVQCEFINNTTHLAEECGVTSYSVQLY